MIFARYIGPKSGENKFIPGKVYQALPGFGYSGAVDMTSICVDDETGKRCTIATDDNLFQCLDEVYAVVVKPVAALERGQVVTIIGIDDDFYNLKDGYFKATMFEILDSTNVTTGSYVLDTKSQQWIVVSAVDENLNMAAEGEAMRPVTEFRFPVGNDGVLSEPLFKCINAEGLDGELVEGSLYRAESVDAARELVFVKNEKGSSQSYMMSRFTADF